MAVCNVMAKYESLYERLVANSVKPDDQNENGCWIWTGRTDGKTRCRQYGRMNLRIDGEHKAVQPHRVMEGIFRLEAAMRDAEPHEFDPLELFLVFDPDKETLEHLCHCTLCICPDHWIIVDRATNTALMRARSA